MANPRLPPPDQPFNGTRIARSPSREPRLSLQEAAQQARAARAIGSGTGSGGSAGGNIAGGGGG
ncbi:MAG: hypothetical protein EBX30_11390, partial [Betaproteobacteria bacterium]|nr:hypothetical protein [Betaproteobacteria bacterium]